MIDLESTRKPLQEKPDEFVCNPASIAEICFSVSHQTRSAWAFDVTVRPFGEIR